MAIINTIKGTQLKILIGDGGSPEVFAHPCMINLDRAVNWESSGTDEEIPLCEDPDALAWNLHTKMGLKGTISGSGKLNQDDVDTFFDWLNSDDAKNVHITYGDESGSTLISGQWKLTQFNATGTRGSVATASITMVSHGVQTRSMI